MATYFAERNQTNILKLREIERTLPSFCSDYFVGIEQRTSPLTRLNYAYDFRTFFRYLSQNKFFGTEISAITLTMLDAVTATDIERYLAYFTLYRDADGVLHENNEKAKARMLSSIRSLFKYFFNKDKLSANVATKVETPKLHDKEIVRLETNEVVQLLDTVENGNHLTRRQQAFHKRTAIRDTAILTLFLGTGIRISELVGLDVNDVDFATQSFRVTRKGGNRVILYFNDEVASALYDWIKQRPSWCEEDETALFLSLQQKRIGVRAVENLVKKYAKPIAPLKPISPHKLRSTFGTNLYRETKDIYVVAEVLGHSDVNTTKRHYAAIGEDIRKSAAERVNLYAESEDRS